MTNITDEERWKISEKGKELRIKLALSKDQLSEKLGISVHTIKSYEGNGIPHDPTKSRSFKAYRRWLESEGKEYPIPQEPTLNKFEQVKRQFLEKETETIRLYCDLIVDGYDSIKNDSKKRSLVRNRLEEIIEVFLTDSMGPIFPKGIPEDFDMDAFDIAEAKAVRKKSRTTQYELADICQTSQVSILRYEQGDFKKTSFKKSKSFARYINWLKEHGYNPFNI